MTDLLSTQFLKPLSFGGFSLQEKPYQTIFRDEALVEQSAEVSTGLVEIANQFPVDVGRQPQARSLTLHVRISCPKSYSISQAYQYVESLYAAFDPIEDLVQDLIVLSPNGQRRLACRSEAIMPVAGVPTLYIVKLVAADACWSEVDEHTNTQVSKNTSPISYDITVAGNTRCFPTFEFSPQGSKDHTKGYKRRWQVVVANKVPRTLMDTLGAGYPIDLANNLLNTDAEQTAGNILTSLDDLRVFVDGRKISGHVGSDRWVDPAGDDPTTKVWCNISFQPRKTLATIATAMTATSPANGGDIVVNNAGGLSGWPDFGFFVIDDEVFYYPSRTENTYKSIVRACRNTAAAIHTISSICYWVEHEITIEYDYTAAVNPPASADLMPVISLADSTNALHVYHGPFVSSATMRTGQFLPSYAELNALSPDMSMQDTGAELEFIDSPAALGKPQANSVELYTPCGVDTAADSITLDAAVPDNLLFRAYGTDEEGNEGLLAEWNSGNDGDAEVLTPSAVLTRLRYAALVRMITGAWTGDTGDMVTSATLWRYQQFTLDADSNVYGVLLRLKKGGVPNGGLQVAFFSDVAATSASGTTTSAPGATTMADTGQAWATDQWIGAIATIGNASMLVTGNSATTITGAAGWQPATPSTGSYKIAFANTVPGMQFSDALLIGEADIGTSYGDVSTLFTSGLGYISLKAGKYWIGAKRSDAAGSGDNTITLSVSPTTIYLKGGMSGGGFSGIVASGPTGLGASAHEASQQAPDWGTPTNIYTSNNAYATLAVPVSGSDSYTLKCTAFGFSVPSTATILGIVATIEMKANKYAGGGAVRARLYKAGTVGGSEHSFFTTLLSTSDQTFTLGGANDLWGNALTYTDVNNAGFGIGFSIAPPSVSSLTVSVDYVTITVYAQTDTGINFNQTSRFGILGDGSVCQPEVPIDSGATIITDDHSYVWDTPPYVKVQASEEIYSYDGILENTATGQSIAISFIGALFEMLTINCETGEVLGGALGLPKPWAVEWADEVNRLYLVPGVNTLVYTEVSIGTLTIATKHTGKWL